MRHAEWIINCTRAFLIRSSKSLSSNGGAACYFCWFFIMVFYMAARNLKTTWVVFSTCEAYPVLYNSLQLYLFLLPAFVAIWSLRSIAPHLELVFTKSPSHSQDDSVFNIFSRRLLSLVSVFVVLTNIVVTCICVFFFFQSLLHVQFPDHNTTVLVNSTHPDGSACILHIKNDIFENYVWPWFTAITIPLAGAVATFLISVWLLSLLHVSASCSAAVEVAIAGLARLPAEVENMDSIFAPVRDLHSSVLPALNKGWSLGILSLVSATLASATFAVILHAIDGPDPAPFVQVVGELVLAVLIPAVPAIVSSKCRELLTSLNDLALNHPDLPELHQRVKVLERRLTGGYRSVPVDTFGFTLFGALISPGFLKSAAVSLAGAAVIVVPILYNAGK